MTRQRYAVRLRRSDLDRHGRVDNRQYLHDEVLDEAGRVYVRARTALLRIDPETGRTIDFDPALRRGLESCRSDGEVVDATATATVGRLADRS